MTPTSPSRGWPRPHDVRVLEPRRLDPLAGRLRAALAARPGGTAGAAAVPALALCRVFRPGHDLFVEDGGELSAAWELLAGDRDPAGAARRPHALLGVRALSYAAGLARACHLAGDTDRRVVAVVRAGVLRSDAGRAALAELEHAPGPGVVVLALSPGPVAPGGLFDLGHDGAGRTGSGGFGSALFGMVREARGLLGFAGEPTAVPGVVVDGRRVREVEAALRRARDAGRTVVVRCPVEAGGRGVPGALALPVPSPAPSTAGASWAAVFDAELAAVGAERPELIAVCSGDERAPGIGLFSRTFPERTVTLSGSESHVAGCAAGLAGGQLHPVVPVGDGFVDRVAAPPGVTFVVGGDAEVVPGVRWAEPRDAARLRELLGEAAGVGDAVTVVRVPDGGVPDEVAAVAREGGVDVLCAGTGRDVLIVAVGAGAGWGLGVAAAGRELGLSVTVVDPRWVSPVPESLVGLAGRHGVVVVVGGGDALRAALAGGGLGGGPVPAVSEGDVAGGARAFALRLAGRVASLSGGLRA
ncbi:transketolase C-terminal domain-containing protein [Streptomyces xanthii]|uniref:Transketolase C-terminal domain-containing protein n=1 Tax=Streptomyces xanthii TaxID=2768069 RepID=A0A7H1BBF9_9ACTN|nr:transketolase C-terminal domain-containing protein [Streptomyces xanthii]QNS06064.1 hypothetical protein IAG42_22425 [Streptomyces xanthii]